jgi:hypothetical protein
MELTERELLVEIHTEVKNLKVSVDKIQENCKGQTRDCSEILKDKIGKFTFILAVTIFSGILGYVAIDIKDLRAEVDAIVKSIK